MYPYQTPFPYRPVSPELFMPQPAQAAAQPSQAGAVAATTGNALRAAAGFASLIPAVGPLIGLGLAGAGTVASAIGTLANNKVQRLNRERIAALEKKQASGTLGLSAQQQRQAQQALASPVQRAAAEGRLAAERQMASMQGGSAGDLQRLQQQQAAMTAAGGQQAAAQVMAANEQRKAEQLAELEQRVQAQAQMRADDIATILGGAKSSAGAGGALIGSASKGALGSAFKDIGMRAMGGGPAATGMGTSLTPDDLALVEKLNQDGQLMKILAAVKQQEGGY